MIDLYNGVRVCVRNCNRGRPWVAGVVKSQTGPLVHYQHLDQIRKTLQSERHARGEPEDLLVKPIHPSPGEPEWSVAPDLESRI